MRSIRAGVVISAFVAVLATVEASAQMRPSFQESTRFSVGFSFMLSDPKEEFGLNTNKGFGGSGSFLYHIDRAGWFGLRFDGSGSEYGREEKRVPLSPTI